MFGSRRNALLLSVATGLREQAIIPIFDMPIFEYSAFFMLIGA